MGIKHGRVCMIATIGFMVTSVGYRFPGELSPSTGITFEKVPAGLDAIGAVPALGWVQIFVFCGLIDTGLFRADPARDPGDFENGGILGVPNASGPVSDAEGRKRKLNAELANGRLAMVAIMGMLFQNGWIGSSGSEMWGFEWCPTEVWAEVFGRPMCGMHVFSGSNKELKERSQTKKKKKRLKKKKKKKKKKKS